MSEGRWKPYRHLLLLNRKLVDVAAGRIKRLAVFMPPRHGKSELISRYFPAWYLGAFPDKRIILASYEADFAATWGRKARNILEEHGQQLFGVEVSRESSAASRWDLAGHEGGMVTAGVRGPITGRGAHVAIIDDPVKNDQEAHSQTHRDAVWDWYRATFSTRLQDNGAIILVMTRWHEDDLAGRLLKAMGEGGEKWEVLKLPAIAEEDDPLGRQPGEPLCPELFPLPALESIRDRLGSYWWAALYQQRPAPPGGTVFKRAWFRIVDGPPPGLNYVRFWDLATSTRETADWTAGARVGVDQDGKLYIVDMVREKLEWPDTRRLIVATAQVDGRGTRIGVEKVAFQLAAWQDLMREPGLLGHAVEPVPVDRDKVLRAQPWAARAEAGKVYLVRGSWNADFLSEVEAFPHGQHDDQVDAVSGAVQMLAQAVALQTGYMDLGYW